MIAGGVSAAEGVALAQSLTLYILVLLKSYVYSPEHAHARHVPMARRAAESLHRWVRGRATFLNSVGDLKQVTTCLLLDWFTTSAIGESSPVVQGGVGGCLLWQGLLKQGPSSSASQGGAHHQKGERLVESHPALCGQHSSTLSSASQMSRH